MKDSSREITQIPELTMGLDLGDKFSYYCIIDKSGKRVEEGRVKTQRRAMERFFKSQPKMRVVLETGTHSRWVQAIAKEQGHEEIVANPRQVRLISQNRKKSDRKDGELLGRLGRVDPQLRITKAGDRFVRKLLVGSAQYILGPFGSDCDLRRYGERIASRGGKSAKKRAVVAVARKLSVLLHHLWVTGETYEPLYNSEEYLEGAA